MHEGFLWAGGGQAKVCLNWLTYTLRGLYLLTDNYILLCSFGAYFQVNTYVLDAFVSF